MAEYYFDIETHTTQQWPNPDVDKIISIQFQRISIQNGRPIGELNILKEWESSEEDIVIKFYNKFFREGLNIWNFIPVGYKLTFEWEFLISKFTKYTGKKFTSRDLNYRIPHVDVRPIIILLNDGKFKGAKLDKFTGKTFDGSYIKKWYEENDFESIEKYIRNEAESFLLFLQKVKFNINKVVE